MTNTLLLQEILHDLITLADEPRASYRNTLIQNLYIKISKLSHVNTYAVGEKEVVKYPWCDEVMC